jgi:hypothetical protein
MKTKRNLFIVVFVLAALLASCASSALPADGAEISWEQAVELLHDGQVTAVFQTHALDVTLTLVNGANVHTVEPSIDAIFHEIDACGQPCADIAIATE